LDIPKQARIVDFNRSNSNLPDNRQLLLKFYLKYKSFIDFIPKTSKGNFWQSLKPRTGGLFSKKIIKSWFLIEYIPKNIPRDILVTLLEIHQYLQFLATVWGKNDIF
jgi:hypothetical protein